MSSYRTGTPVLAQSLMVLRVQTRTLANPIQMPKTREPAEGHLKLRRKCYVARVGPRKPMVIGGVLFIIGYPLVNASA
eukprot:1108293-Amorphochlora_amoeboformis.AAC.1